MRAAFLAVGFLVACGTDPAEEPPLPTPRATWYQDVGPIAAKHCMGCHREGGIGAFSMENFDDVYENATKMLAEIDEQRMPPFDAREESGCTPRFGWVDDPRLNAGEKKKFREWLEDGAQSGEVAVLPKPPVTDLQTVTKTVAPTTPFTTQGNRDQFTCFIMDPHVTELAWMTGLQVRPGNPKVVHHVVVTEIDAGPEQDALVAEHPVGTPFDCSQMATPASFVLNVWTPGNQPMQTPDDLAVPITAGSKIVMQIHYHPANTTNDPDTTSIDLKLTTTWPKKMYFVAAVGNAPDEANGLEPGAGDENDIAEFKIPANVADHVEDMSLTLPADFPANVRLFSVNPHMHLVGTHIESRIFRAIETPAQPANECLANGAWNFDWQRTYIYNVDLDHLPTIAAGDRIEVKCHWNNTLDNPFVTRMLNDAGMPNHTPIDIPLGEQTTNEMCLEIFGVAIDAPPAPRYGGSVKIDVPKLGTTDFARILR